MRVPRLLGQHLAEKHLRLTGTPYWAQVQIGGGNAPLGYCLRLRPKERLDAVCVGIVMKQRRIERIRIVGDS